MTDPIAASPSPPPPDPLAMHSLLVESTEKVQHLERGVGHLDEKVGHLDSRVAGLEKDRTVPASPPPPPPPRTADPAAFDVLDFM